MKKIAIGFIVLCAVVALVWVGFGLRGGQVPEQTDHLQNLF